MNKLPTKILADLEKYAEKTILEEIQKQQASYHVSGKTIENIATKKVLDFFKENKKTKVLDSRIPKTKTEWPDLTLKMDWSQGSLKTFFEIKAADSSGEPANDLGTLKSLWKKHILDDLGPSNLDNLFMVFVKYSKKDGQITDVDKVYVAHYFKFIGTRKVGSVEILKYRKKDGNTRPKTWEEIENIKVKHLTKEELKSFAKRYYLASIFRSIDIMKEHREILSSLSNPKAVLRKEFRLNKIGLDIEKINAEIKPKIDILMKKVGKKQSKIREFSS